MKRAFFVFITGILGCASVVWASSQAKIKKELSKEVDSLLLDVEGSTAFYKKSNQKKWKKRSSLKLKKPRKRKKRSTYASQHFEYKKSLPKKKRRIKKKKKVVLTFQEPESTFDPVVEERGQSQRVTAPLREEPLQSSLHSRHSYGKKPKKWGLGVYTFYSLADKVNSYYEDPSYGVGGQPLDSSFQASSAFGLGLDHSMYLFKASYMDFGYQAGIGYEFDRTIKVTASGQPLNFKDPSLSLALPYVNAKLGYRFSPSWSAYALGGLNYSFPFVKNGGGEKFSGLLGFQGGVGVEVNSWVSLEVLYRRVHFDVQADPSTASYGLGSTFSSYGSYNPLLFQQQDRGFNLIQDDTFYLEGVSLQLRILF
ncbi:MAG: hypothetical protein D6797_03490 [Bdellovibrio sp.]|nr:MAG: hypothetical protein D6797_03490 [Bdellovibrio sp.]